jgi:hypothetical protein
MAAIVISPSGSLFVADTNNQVIRRADPYTAVSRKTQGAGAFDVDLPLTGSPAIESRSGGSASEYQLVLTGYAPVTFSAAHITLGNGTVKSTAGSGTSTIVLNLSAVTEAQTIAVTLAGVKNGVGTRDVIRADERTHRDVNAEGIVNSADVIVTRNISGQQTDVTNFAFDVNADGAINSADAFVVRARSGTSLP